MHHRRLALIPALLPPFLFGAFFSAVSHPAVSDDKVRQETGVDAAVAQFGTTGKGVIVAIMDRGIDWKNADFRNNDGTTRIKYIFDLTDDTGAASNPYGKGTLYTEADINGALTGGTALATRDAVGHGTTTAGLAAGNGRNRADRLYRGMAPDATLIVAKIVADGTPAHGTQPAEAAFYDPARIPIAIDFIKAKAAELGMPVVMVLNIGSIGGPTDGTSDLARKIDATVGPGKPGIVFVNGTGDDGGMPNHAGGTVVQGGSAAIQITKGVAGSLYFDLWYPGTDRFDVTIQSPTTTYGPYPSPATNADYDVQSTSDFLYYQLGSSVHFYNATNTKREIWVRLDGPVGNYIINLSGASVTGGRFDATLNASEFWNSSSSNKFTNFVVPGSIWDGASAFHDIVPNSYIIRTSWIDIDGFTRGIVGEGNVGEIWRGSSVGPTFDGRLGVDFSAPGDRTIAPYAPDSWWATFRFNEIQGEGGRYGMAGAVSAANPISTGIIALMLQRNPTLDAAQIKLLLQQTAKSDSFTGAVPNTTWGYGKINAQLAVQKTVPLGTLTLAPSNPPGGTSTVGTVTLNSPAPAGGTVINLANTNPAAHLPGPTVTVPATQTSVNFTVTTDGVSTDQTGMVTATLNGALAQAALTVTGTPVSSLTLNPTSIVGGNPVTGTVTLAAAASPGDVTVNLSSNNAAAAVPATVTVLAGQTSADFTVNTTAITSVSSLIATISAQAGGPAKTAPLTVRRLEALSVGLVPGSLAGGNNSTGTVTLNGPAPTGGTVVALASDKAQAAVPANITVAAGQTSATFTVSTTPVTAQVIANISATLAVKKSKALTIKPPAVSALALAPTSLIGGGTSTGTVTLTGPAPTGGIVVTLGSSKSEATLPASVTVAAGSKTATFTVNTAVVYSSVVAAISAAAGGVTKPTNLTIKPNAVKTLVLTPATVMGGSGSTGKVTLSAAAGTGGVIVTLSSDHAEAGVPSSVTVAAGATTATFPITTTSVAAQVKATIKSAIGTAFKTAVLTINP